VSTLKPLMTTAEVAEILREKPENVARRCVAGQIRAVRISGEWRISEVDLAEFIEPSNVRQAPRVRSTAGRRRAS
jgi:excisionase family DNA binding protein